MNERYVSHTLSITRCRHDTSEIGTDLRDHVTKKRIGKLYADVTEIKYLCS